MKNNKFKITLLILINLLMIKIVIGQNNVFKVSPIKLLTQQRINFGYEKSINSKTSLLAEVQLWRNDRTTKGKGRFFSVAATPDKTYINRGTRFHLGFRRYEILTKDERINNPDHKRRVKLYYGLSAFSGFHHISRTYHPYTETFFSWTIFEDSDTNNSVRYSKKFGETDLISSGVLADVGFQFTLASFIIIDVGLKGGRSWTNQQEDHLTLYPDNTKEGTATKSFKPAINGFFIEPTLNLGFTF